jgi:hypothetical protein
MKQAFIYFMAHLDSFMLFDAPFIHPYYPNLLPDMVITFEPCERPYRLRDKSRPPMVGDTIFINDADTVGVGYWVRLIQQESK